MRTSIPIYLLLVILLIAAGSASAQLPAVSQMWLSPQLNTPVAMAGSNYTQVTSLYRRQAMSEDLGFQTFALSGNLPLYYKGGSRIGTVGIHLMHDRSGELGLVSTNVAMASYAYEASLTTRHQLVGGLQIGYFSQGINWSKVRTDAQWQWGNYNPDLAVGEQWSDERNGALLINAGLGYHLMSSAGFSRVQFNVGAYNLGKSKINILEGSSEATPVGIVLYVAGFALKTADYDLSPMMRWHSQAGISEVRGGALMRKSLKSGAVNEQHIGLGIQYSNAKIASFSLQFAQPAYVLSIGYDLPVGDVDGATRNAVEATLGWRMKKENKGTNSFREYY